MKLLTKFKHLGAVYYFRKYFLLPIKILRISIVDTIRQDGIEHAGYLSFLSIFSLFPFLIFLMLIIGYLGAEEAGNAIIQNVIASLPKDAAKSILPLFSEITSGPKQNFLTIAIIGVIWTASSSVEGFRTILNRAYRVHLPPPYLLRRLISVVEFFILTFSATIMIMIFVVIPYLVNLEKIKLPEYFISFYNMQYWRSMSIFSFFVLVASLLYYLIPNVKQKITTTFPGAILVVMLWVMVEKVFSYYLANYHQFDMVYGSLAGIMIYLMLFYLINLIFIFGAVFNYHFYRTYKIFLRG